MTTSFIRTVGAELAESGYLVCAITPGEKRPMGKAWAEHPLTREQCAAFSTQAAGVGIICGKGATPVYAIDVDVMGDVECSDALRCAVATELGLKAEDMVVRVGNAPKFLVPVRGDAAGWRKLTSPWYEKNAVRSRIEFLGDGQQFVAAAIHPTTNRPYDWEGAAPMINTVLDPVDFLPLVSYEMAKGIVEACCRVLEAHGWAEADGGSTVQGTDDALMAEMMPQHPMGASIAEARTWLDGFPGKDDYDVWLRVGMALNHEFGNRPEAEEALDLWDEWSRDAKSYKGRQDLEYRWRGFAQRTRRSVTCRWLKSEWQKRTYDKAREFTEEGRVARFSEYFRGSVRYAVDEGCWYQYDGLRWVRLSAVGSTALAAYVCDDLLRVDIGEAAKDGSMGKEEYAAMQNFYKRLQQSGRAERIALSARKNANLWINGSEFNSQPRYLGVRNGVVDLETGGLVEPSPQQLVSLQMGTRFEAGADCPVFKQTISEVFFGDTAMVDYAQRLFGYALLGEPVREIMAIFHGNGCNGKSTIVNVMRDLFGEYGHTASAELMTSVGSSRSNVGGARADLIALKHKRLVVMSEIDQRARLQESAMKALVSQDEISARGLYQAEVSTFRPSWVAVMLTNYLPRIDGGDDGVWRRIHAVPFDRNFDKDTAVKKDVNRSLELRKELPGILNWVLEGVKKYREKGLDRPERVQRESEEYKRDSDILADWIDERCDLREDARTPTSTAWTSWDQYSQANGVSHAISDKTKLTKALKRKGIACRACRIDGRIVKCYIGLSLGGEF